MKPRILIINPNSSEEMTGAIHRNAAAFAGDDMEVLTVPTPGTSPFIATYEDHAMAAPGMVRLLRENEDSFDAFVIACHGDPNIDLMKEITTKPVVGIAEASMKMATMLGHSFSVIAPVERTVPNKKALIDRYGLARTWPPSARQASNRGRTRRSGSSRRDGEPWRRTWRKCLFSAVPVSPASTREWRRNWAFRCSTASSAPSLSLRDW